MVTEKVQALMDLGTYTEKVNYIKQHQDDQVFCTVLKYAIDTTIKFGLTVYAEGRGNKIIDMAFLDKLKQLAQSSARKTSIVVYGLEADLRELKPDHAELANHIINKTLRVGLSNTLLNKALPELGVFKARAMLAYKFDPSTVSFPCIATTKIEGQRCIYDHKTKAFYTRTGKKYVGLNTLARLLANATTLDCEIVVPGIHFYSGSGQLRSNNDVDDAMLYILDAPLEPSPNFITRINAAYATIEAPGSLVLPVPYRECFSLDDIYAYFNEVRDQGFEGLVIRPYKYRYVNNRSKKWAKLKAIDTIDAKISGAIEGTGKYTGMLGALTVKHPIPNSPLSTITQVGTGFSDNQRTHIWTNISRLIGLTAEIEFHEYTPSGCLREPRFKGIRYDK